MYNIELGKRIKETVNALNNTVEFTFMIVITFNVFILMGISYIWSLINSL